MRHIELCGHCWRFSKAAAYFLSSLHLYPPTRVHVTATICFSLADDDTHNMLRFFDLLYAGSVARWSGQQVGATPNVELNLMVLEPEEIFNRSIGRNLSSLATQADIWWACDIDYFFGPGALDSLADLDLSSGKLWFPRITLFNKTKENGDSYTQRIDKPQVVDIDPADFVEHRLHRAIGGAQIVSGDTARQLGYCNSPQHQQPFPEWRDTKGDRTYRGILETPGIPLDMPSVFRIRQSREFVCDDR